MDAELAYDLLKHLTQEALKILEEFRDIADNEGYIYCLRLLRIMHLIAPIVTALLVYQYVKYLLIFNAHQYEEYVRRKYEHIKKVSRQLKFLAKRYGNLYFCYMPMNHGTALPRTYTLFLAIKDVLMNSNRPATRGLRTDLLMDLLHSDYSDTGEDMRRMEAPEREFFDLAHDDIDPLSEFNLDIMKCSRELIIQGVKDFDVMSTVYRIMETAVEDSN